ncbi:alpha/beta hydrolase [Rhodoplanes sp. TEM]|uniref:Alpha/beta hydrolase n=1 Tax=Rhodoplanes tepidamans TaxID=200616 RepID=A0ABT5JIN0_RHOTP|nr:alpha/beta hydrolase [Rhodoplanes tepidamans]MDC7789243.1 alpha/beta hydrolase [Rhodoplanes tepidamans]MDC7985819.1 alpha/beta hydrolase [Rhodoplanes sp. TEM]MDQ0358855.1 pimeloyl-ACP methyl ester carboxylesterase [Rhodoplanes tepidamans]
MPAPRVIETRGGRLEYAAAGEGPAVLCLHGGMGGYDQGLLLGAAAVGDGFSVVAPSRAGYLGTPLATGPSPEQQADVCVDLLDALGMADAAVVAISGGGPCALQFALRHRERCRGLVMISACSARLEIRLPWQYHLMRLVAHVPALAAAFGRYAMKNPERALVRSLPAPEARARLLADPEAAALWLALQATIGNRLGDRMPGTDNDTARFRAAAGWPLEAIAVPVLAVHGTADRIVAFSHAEQLAARVPGAELLAIPGGEHVCLFAHRSDIRARAAAFLARTTP